MLQHFSYYVEVSKMPWTFVLISWMIYSWPWSFHGIFIEWKSTTKIFVHTKKFDNFFMSIGLKDCKNMQVCKKLKFHN